MKLIAWLFAVLLSLAWTVQAADLHRDPTELAGGIYLASPETLTNGTTATLRLDSTGALVTTGGGGGEVSIGASATATAASGCYLQSAASTNATNCKASAGNFYGVRAVNTTGTLYYLRMYNASGSPTCSSATGFIESIPIPASTSGAGIVAISTIPIAYSTGVAFCFTGGGSSTDNTNAATGVFVTIYYK